jgi:hypothetical protein
MSLHKPFRPSDNDIGLLPPFILSIEKKDRNGRVGYSESREGHSYVRNAYNVASLLVNAITGTGYGAGSLSIKTTAGSVVTNTNNVSARWGSYGDCFTAATGVATNGIIVGSSGQVFSFEDYNLISQITHGITAGTLHYGQTNSGAVSVPAWDLPTRKFTVVNERYFNNDSGGNITVREIGLVSRDVKLNYSTDQYLYARDVLDTEITLADAEQLRVTYTFTQTIPAA